MIKRFQSRVWQHYKTYGRHDLPWRTTTDPYKILVSEVMLQQTQVARVIPKYKAFLKQFPTPGTLATASIHDVLAAWQGLGYNRRGRALKKAAEEIVSTHKGKVPQTERELASLPGIGPYTARAVLAFAFNQPVLCIETNIRTVYLHHFFAQRDAVHDREILEIIDATLDKKKPREWFWALMDYGAYLKQSGIKLNQKKVGYKKQSKFKGSDREIRGAIVRLMTKRKGSKISDTTCAKETKFSIDRIRTQLKRLEKDGLLKREGSWWMLAAE